MTKPTAADSTGWPTEDDDYDGIFDCGGVVDGFGNVHSDADPGL